MELFKSGEEIAIGFDEASFVHSTISKIRQSPQEECSPESVLLVSARFLKAARNRIALTNEVLKPDLHPDDGNATFRGCPTVAVPWLRDDEYEYWSNSANCVPS